MKNFLLIVIISAFCLFTACKEAKTSKTQSIVTERIQYDVSVKSPHPDLDWWVMNLEGQRREWLVDLVLQAAYDGKVQAYNFVYNAMTPEEVKAIGYRNDTLLMPTMEPPYEDSVVVINERLRRHDIQHIRFLEEWRINEKTLQIEKNVLGICLLLSDFEPSSGLLRGYRPLFWVFFDERYPALLR